MADDPQRVGLDARLLAGGDVIEDPLRGHTRILRAGSKGQHLHANTSILTFHLSAL